MLEGFSTVSEEIIRSGKYTKIKSDKDILAYVEYQESWAGHWVKNTLN